MTDIEMWNKVNKYIPILQVKEEILWALQVASGHVGVAKYFLEIGCHAGGSLCMWTQLLDYDGCLIGLSPMRNESVIRNRVIDITGHGVLLVKGLSEDQASFDLVQKYLDGNKLDGIFYDTIHTEEQTEKEFEIYMPLMNSPAVMMFHDIVPNELTGERSTGYFWERIKHSYSYSEIHYNPGDQNFGIGILLL